MPVIPMEDIGDVGVIRDIKPHELPLNAWSNGLNVRFFDKKVVRSKGHQDILEPPAIAPYWAMGVPTGEGYFILYASLQKIRAVVASTNVHTDLTRAVGGNYAATEDLLWNGGLFGDIPIMNNGVDVPQFWGPINVSQPMQDLTNWPGTLRARVLRPFKNYLVALHLFDNNVRKPRRIRWSHQADPGTLPTSWDITDPTVDAGELDLTDQQPGVILDGLQMGNEFIIYNENSIWRMRIVGGRDIMAFQPVRGQGGLLTTGCVSEIPRAGGEHFAATGDDLIIFDGQQRRSVLSAKARRTLGATLSRGRFPRAFTAAARFEHEMWFCYPEAGSDWPTLAIVWNYDEDTISFRDIRNFSYMASVVVDEPTGESNLWDDDTQVWDEDNTVWDNLTPFSQRNVSLIGLNPVDTKISLMNESYQRGEQEYYSFIERQDLGLAGVDRFGQPFQDFDARKIVTRMWIRASGAPFEVRMGARDSETGDLTYTNPVTFTPGVDEFVEFGDEPPQGKFLTVRFESNSGERWQIAGYSLELEVLGRY